MNRIGIHMENTSDKNHSASIPGTAVETERMDILCKGDTKDKKNPHFSGKSLENSLPF